MKALGIIYREKKMDYVNVIKSDSIKKTLKNFTLDVKNLQIPQGFATALIGENGAGKTTLVNILAGIRLDAEGKILFFDKYSEEDRENNPLIKELIGYTGTSNYYLPTWTIEQIDNLNSMLFKDYDSAKFHELCNSLALTTNSKDFKKKVSELSDGNKTKLMLAGVLARKTKLLLLDEPASALDPLMRDHLCDIIRDYISKEEGNTVFFSTHNVSDMENITDYAIILENGQIVEQGFVDDLKEKYILIKGETSDIAAAEKVLFSITKNNYGFEGICLAENLDKLAGMDITTETPSLFQISVAVMKYYTKVRLG